MLHHANRASNALIAPSFRSQGTTSFTTATSISATQPSGLFEGDLMIATMSAGTAFATITEPAGWTLLYESPYQANGIWYKIADATDVSSFSYSWTLSTATTSGRLVVSAWANTSGVECASIGIARQRNLSLNRCMAVGRISRNTNVVRFNLSSSNVTATYPTSSEIYDTSTRLNSAAQLSTVAQGLSALEAATTSNLVSTFFSSSVALKPKTALTNGNTNPYFIASSMNASDASYSSLTVPMPVGVQDGDFLVMVVGSFNSKTGGATCSGWTQEDAFNPSGRTTTILRRTASSEPSTYSVSTNGRTTVHILAFRGSATTFAQKSNVTPTTTSYSATAVTTTANNAIVLNINVALNTSATTFTTPTGFNPITYGEADQSSTAIFMNQQATAGTTGTVTSTASNSASGQTSCLALLYTINPA
jgi:hypothetical protein